MIPCKLTFTNDSGTKIYYGIYRSTCDAILDACARYSIDGYFGKIKAEPSLKKGARHAKSK